MKPADTSATMHRFSNGLRSLWLPPWLPRGDGFLPPVRQADNLASRWAWGIEWQTQWRNAAPIGRSRR